MSARAGDGAERRRGRRLASVLRGVVLAAVLAVTALVVPDSGVHRTEAALVRMPHAGGVDTDGGVVWVLAVGSDARRGQNFLRTRGDALQLIALDARTGSASAIGIPRDSWVSIPGHGRNKVNSALVFGGPELMARAVGSLVGVRPDYVVVTRFPWFEDMVDDIGGITVRNPRPFSDPYLLPRGFEAGQVRLNGYGAMAFSRIRKGLPDGDFGRSANQQRVLRGIQSALAARADRPGYMERAVLTVMRHTATTLPPRELYRLGQAVAQLDRRRITTCVVGGGIGSAAGQSVVFPNVAQARRYGRDADRDARIRRC